MATLKHKASRKNSAKRDAHRKRAKALATATRK